MPGSSCRVQRVLKEKEVRRREGEGRAAGSVVGRWGGTRRACVGATGVSAMSCLRIKRSSWHRGSWLSGFPLFFPEMVAGDRLIGSIDG